MLQVGVGKKQVEVVHDVPTVHDLAEDVLEVLPRNLAASGLDVVVQAPELSRRSPRLNGYIML